MIYNVAVFECNEYTSDTSEMMQWLVACNSPMIKFKYSSVEEIEMQGFGGKTIKMPGKQMPLVVTIADEQMALLFRLKYPRAIHTKTVTHSTPDIFTIKED